MNLAGGLALACSLMLAACVFLYNAKTSAEARAVAAEHLVANMKANDKEVVKYVDRKVEIIKTVPVIRTKLVAGVCHEYDLPGAGSPTADAKPEAGNGVADGLAEEIAACLAESAQLATMIPILRACQSR